MGKVFRNLLISKAKQKSLNIKVVGSLTISDDFIVSGFGNNDYLLFESDKVPAINWGDTFEFQLKYICTEYATWGVYVINSTTNNTIQLKDRSTSLYQYWQVSSFDTSDTSINHSLNTWCYIKIQQQCIQNETNNVVFNYSTDGINWTTVTKTITYSSGANVPTFIGSTLGGYSNLSEYLRGSIDMKECYIKINNNIVWKGVK